MNTKRTPHTNESMSIAQLSKLTNVPYETLRVWAKKGFIHRKQNAENKYYQYDITSYCDTITVQMLRNMEFSFNMIKKYYELGTSEIYSGLFAQAEKSILRKIEKLNESLKKLRLHNNMFIRTLNFSDEITESQPPFDKIFRLNIENVPKYLTDPSDCLSLLSIDGAEITEGECLYLTYHSKSESELLWRKNNLAKYFHFMLPDIYPKNLYKSKAEENIKKIAIAGFSAKYLILKYIFTLNHLQDGKNNFVSYFDAWIEAYPNNNP